MRRIRYNFWIDPTLLAGLRAVKVQTGVPESEQIRRAIAATLHVPPPVETPRRAPRRRKTGRRS